MTSIYIEGAINVFCGAELVKGSNNHSLIFVWYGNDKVVILDSDFDQVDSIDLGYVPHRSQISHEEMINFVNTSIIQYCDKLDERENNA